MSVALSTAAIIGGVVAGGASVGSAVIGAHAAGKAADQQAESADKALGFQKDVFDTEQANYAPYLDAGKTSLSKLMEDLGNGTFGPGSNPAAPQFHTPTLDEARATPGYEFTRQQGLRGVDAGAAARGGVLSGGTAKAEMGYATGLADSTYNDVFNRSLSTFGAGMQGYQANLAKQAQEYSQLYQPASLGENAAAQSGNTAQQVAGNVGSLMTQVGNAQASGTIGSANAIAGGLGGVANAGQSTLNSLLLSRMLTAGGGGYSPAIGNGGAPIPSDYGADLSPIWAPPG